MLAGYKQSRARSSKKKKQKGGGRRKARRATKREGKQIRKNEGTNEMDGNGPRIDD